MIVDDNNQVNLKEDFDLTTTGYYYRYTGSLTTEPCTEGVEFLIYRDPISIGTSELNKIKDKINSRKPNNRKTQSLNNREVRLTGPPCYPRS